MPDTELRRTLSQAQAQSLLQTVIEAMPSAVVLVSPGAAIELANSRAARLFGYRAGELAGMAVEDLMPARYRSAHARDHAQFMQHPGTREMGVGRELFGLRKDGSEFPIEVGLDVLRTPHDTFVLASVIDATTRLEAQRSAADATALAQSIIDSAPFSIVAADIDGTVLEVSPAAERLLGCSKAELVGQRWPMAIHDSADVGSRSIEITAHRSAGTPGCGGLAAKVHSGQTDAREWTLHTADGRSLPIHLAVSGLRHHDGRLAGYIGIAHDISERKRSEAHMRFIAEHDALTGLPNRALLRDRLNVAIARARRNGSKVGVLLLDLDHFKRVNDSLGHHVGDRLLISVARRLTSVVRACDTVARMGGDEFVVVLPDLHRPAEAHEVAAKLVERLCGPVNVDGHTLEVTPSLGVCCFPDDGDSPDLLLMNADTAMYAAKEAGRRRYLAFTAAMADAASERWTLERAMRQALEAGGFQMNYQPQICLRTQQVIGVEALLRWPQDSKGFVDPDRFIPVAEQTGLISPIGEWALRTACTEIGALWPTLPPGFRLAVNLSPRQLRSTELFALVLDSLRAGGLPASALELEITEGALLHDDIADTVAQLRAAGVRVAIDDFGTGFSSLSHITRFPIDSLKIDRSFVRGIDVEVSQTAVTAAIVAMGERLGIQVIAEGIETPRQLQALIDLGCSAGQGFLFSAAVPAANLAEAIRRISQPPAA